MREFRLAQVKAGRLKKKKTPLLFSESEVAIEFKRNALFCCGILMGESLFPTN